MSDGQCEYYGTRYVPEEPQKTLRDELAMAALNGILSAGPLRTDTTYTEIAGAAYMWADAMLAARNG